MQCLLQGVFSCGSQKEMVHKQKQRTTSLLTEALSDITANESDIGVYLPLYRS